MRSLTLAVHPDDGTPRIPAGSRRSSSAPLCVESATAAPMPRTPTVTRARRQPIVDDSPTTTAGATAQPRLPQMLWTP